MTTEAAQLSPTTRAVLESLCQHAEGESYPLNGSDNWRDVYIDNARPDGMSARSFAGHLSKLTEAGFYRAIDNFAWGSVRDEAFACFPAIARASQDAP